mmetsp:Transcript_1038/g.2407  ORF Transcript_1038/g.2407 Transcript_1038/m.2407 type:complete len:243 (+) Transcript_1038:692-1420(+)
MQNLRPFIAHAVTCTDSQLFCEHLQVDNGGLQLAGSLKHVPQRVLHLPLPPLVLLRYLRPIWRLCQLLDSRCSHKENPSVGKLRRLAICIAIHVYRERLYSQAAIRTESGDEGVAAQRLRRAHQHRGRCVRAAGSHLCPQRALLALFQHGQHRLSLAAVQLLHQLPPHAETQPGAGRRQLVRRHCDAGRAQARRPWTLAQPPVGTLGGALPRDELGRRPILGGAVVVVAVVPAPASFRGSEQ